MAVSREEVRKIGELAKLKLKDSEVEFFTEQMNEILGYVEKLNELDTENVEPLQHPVEGSNVVREDIRRDQVTTEEALKNAPSKDEKYFKVPKVISQ